VENFQCQNPDIRADGSGWSVRFSVLAFSDGLNLRGPKFEGVANGLAPRWNLLWHFFSRLLYLFWTCVFLFENLISEMCLAGWAGICCLRTGWRSSGVGQINHDINYPICSYGGCYSHSWVAWVM